MTDGKPRLVRINEMFRVVAPLCPYCEQNDMIRYDGDASPSHFVCDRCGRTLTRDEVIKGQTEAER